MFVVVLSMPINYSKWDHIEVSDDEDDTHPNVDTGSLFRWRHQARLERMAEQKRKKEDLAETKQSNQQRVKELETKLAQTDIAQKDKHKFKTELDDLNRQEAEFRKKEEELSVEEKKAPLNVDTLSHDGFSKTRITKEKPPPEPVKMTEEEREKEMQDFWDKNGKLIKKFGFLKKYDDSKNFILENIHLCQEHTANYLTYECLQLEIGEKRELMEHMAHQCVVMQYLLELSKQLNVNPQTPQLVSNFFTKLKKAADTEYREMFDDELRQFTGRIKARAEVKRNEAMEEYEREEKEKRIAASPGGLDSVEVFESLPKSMQDCFESQNIGRLQEVALTMDTQVFKDHLNRCIQSGLWVPDANVAKAEAEAPDETDEYESLGPESPDPETQLRQRQAPKP